MNRKRPALVVLTLCAIVLISFVAGLRTGGHQTRVELQQRFDPERWDEYAMDLLNERLHLSSDQQSNIQAAIDSAVSDMRALREQTIQRTTAIVDQLLSDIDQELTPDQRVQAESLAPSRDELTIELLNVKSRGSTN